MRLTSKVLWSSGCALLIGFACTSLAWAQTDKARASVNTMWADGEALAKTKNCLGCHQLDSKRVGPSYRSVAERYAPLQAAQAYLAISIQQGGANRWGAVPMPAQPQVSPAEAGLLAAWILSLSAR